MTTIKTKQTQDRWYSKMMHKLTGGSDKPQNEVSQEKNIKVSSSKASKLVSEPIKPEEKKKDRIIKRRKRLKQYKRMCLNCQQIFEVSRKDAKYCSGSCRKAVSMNGDSSIDYGNAADQFYKKLMLNLLEDILGYNNVAITRWHVRLYIGYIDIGNDLFLEYLSINNHLKNIINNELYEFLQELFKVTNVETSNSFLLRIPQGYLISWQELVDRMKSNKPEENVYYMRNWNRNT